MRRRPPKVPARLDISPIYKEYEDLDPWIPKEWFRRDAKLRIEVGSGKGLFLCNFGKKFPEDNFLGIEYASGYAQAAAGKVAANQLPNVLVAGCDALKVFSELVPDRSVYEVHVYFPDPWWKNRHRKRRVLNKAFLKDVARTLTTDGMFHFWTDVVDYYKSTLRLIENHVPELIGPEEVEELEPEHLLDYRTHRERRVRIDNLPVYRTLYRIKG